MQEVILSFDDDGNAVIEANGIRGSGCQALTRTLEQALGTTVKDVKKHEFSQPATQGQQQKAAQ